MIVVISAGLGQPSASRLLGGRLAGATVGALRVRDASVPEVRHVELRELAADLANQLVTGIASPALGEVADAVRAAEAIIAVTPVFNASYSGLFKLFFDLLDEGALAGKRLLMAATGGTPRHSLAIDQTMLPLFFYLKASVAPTAVFAATDDWGADSGLSARIERAGADLAALVHQRPAPPPADPWALPDFETLLRG